MDNLEVLYQTLKSRGLHINKAVSLAELTTWGVGGKAALLLIAQSIPELSSVVLEADKLHVRWMVIGNGSNLLFADGGFPGMIVKLGRGFDRVKVDGRVCRAGAGVSLSKLVREASEKALGDLTFLTGIPGTVGGAIAVNAGAQGRSISECLSRVWYLDKSAEVIESDISEMCFTYRYSSLHGAGVIVEAAFALREEDREALLAKRKQYQWARRYQPKRRTAGCVFKNPGSEMPAGRLIEAAGLKGLRIGGAEVSKHHANFIVTDEGATSEDVVKLIKEITSRVKGKAGIDLDLEVEIVPDSSS